MLKKLLKTSDHTKWSETGIKQENQLSSTFVICLVTNYVGLVY